MPFAIGVDHPKRVENIGVLWRSAYCLGASMVFTVGRRYDLAKERGDTVKTWRQIPLLHFPDWSTYRESAPLAWIPVGVEIGRDAEDLSSFAHPREAVYILGAEDHGLTDEAATMCKTLVVIPSRHCLNVAVAGSIVMYDRAVKRRARS